MYSASQREIGQHDNRVCLEVGTKLLSCHTEGQCCLFETGIPSSAPNRDFLTKNIGLYFRFLSSLNKVALTEASNTAK